MPLGKTVSLSHSLSKVFHIKRRSTCSTQFKRVENIIRCACDISAFFIYARLLIAGWITNCRVVCALGRLLPIDKHARRRWPTGYADPFGHLLSLACTDVEFWCIVHISSACPAQRFIDGPFEPALIDEWKVIADARCHFASAVGRTCRSCSSRDADWIDWLSSLGVILCQQIYIFPEFLCVFCAWIMSSTRYFLTRQ